MLHNITKPRPWIEGAQIIEDVFEDAQPLKRVEVKRQEWKKHWQVDTPEQMMNSQPWENRALQELEAALPPVRAEFVEQFGCWPVQAGTKLKTNCPFAASHSMV